MADEIVMQIKSACDQHKVPVPHLFAEFGSLLLARVVPILYSVTGVKQQNDKGLWYMIDSSFITTLHPTPGY